MLPTVLLAFTIASVTKTWATEKESIARFFYKKKWSTFFGGFWVVRDEVPFRAATNKMAKIINHVRQAILQYVVVNNNVLPPSVH